MAITQKMVDDLPKPEPKPLEVVKLTKALVITDNRTDFSGIHFVVDSDIGTAVIIDRWG